MTASRRPTRFSSLIAIAGGILITAAVPVAVPAVALASGHTVVSAAAHVHPNEWKW